MNENAYQNYRISNIETADQSKLILLVYDWVIRHCKMAKEKFKPDTIEERTDLLKKAEKGITELMIGLDMKKGGEVAQNLYRLYDYMNRRLIDAGIKADVAAVDEVLKHLTDLRGAWAQVIHKNKDQISAGGTIRNVAMVG